MRSHEWNGKPSYAFDLTSIDVRNNISAWARQFGKMGYDGILLDGISPCVPAPVPAQQSCPATLLSAPLDKTTNRPYTDAAWREATIGLLTAIRHTAPNTQIFIAETPADLTPSPPTSTAPSSSTSRNPDLDSAQRRNLSFRAPNAVIQSEAKNPLHSARRPSKHEPIPPQAPLPSRGRGRGLGLPTLDARSHPRRSQPPHKSFVPPSCPSWLNSDKLPLVDPSQPLPKGTPVRDLVFMIDLDNTILDNDGVKKDLEAKMLEILATPSPRVSGSSTKSSARIAMSSTSTNR